MNFNFYQPTPSLKDIISNHLNSLAEDNDGNIWAWNCDNGLLKLNVKRKRFTDMKMIRNDPYSISSNKVYKFMFDHSWNIVVGYWRSGAGKWDKLKWKFRHTRSQQLTNALK